MRPFSLVVFLFFGLFFWLGVVRAQCPGSDCPDYDSGGGFGSGSGSGSGEAHNLPCSGHGSTHQGSCVCNNAIPNEENLVGHTGANCEIKVTYARESASENVWKDMNGDLKGNEMQCWVVDADMASESWNYLSVQLERTTAQGDPDLYGLFFGGPGTLGARVPSTSTTGYDFSETSSGSHPTVVEVVSRNDFKARLDAGAAWTKVYLCVYAWNEPTSYSMSARTSQCPSGFTEAGAPTECSTPLGIAAGSEEYHGSCSNAGKCECAAMHRAPDSGEVYEGLGFDDCTATVYDVPTSEKWERDEMVSNNEWDFYKFEVTDDDFQVDVTLHRLDAPEKPNNGTSFWTGSGASHSYLYLKRASPPGSSYTQYDLRPSFDYNHRDTSVVHLVNGTDGFRRGVWYAGIHGTGVVNSNYSISIQRFACPSGCSGRGACLLDQETQRHKCSCQTNYFKDDCSAQRSDLDFGNQVAVEMLNREYEYYVLNGIGTEAARRNVELQIDVSYEDDRTSSYFYPVHPEVLLLQGGDNGYPSKEDYTFRKVLMKELEKYTVNVCASQLTEGQWQVAIYNPVRSRNLKFNVTANEKAYCPNNCHEDEGHGKCQVDGSCVCNGFWALPDCGISSDPDIYGCKKGEYKGEERTMTAQGTQGVGVCMHGCKCVDLACSYDQDKCEEFVCRQPARRKGSEDLCVVDMCKEDEVYENKDAGYTCVRRCSCPTDGGACTMDEKCDPSTFTCHPPFERSPSSSELSCVRRSCDEGSFDKLDNGTIAECVCSSAGATRCTYQSGTKSAEELTKSSRSTKSAGVSGAAAFFLCFFCILGGGTCAYLARHWLEAAIGRVSGRGQTYTSFSDMGSL
ncbi:EGF-like domain-containing protein [Pseudoscourfieldia marina]